MAPFCESGRVWRHVCRHNLINLEPCSKRGFSARPGTLDCRVYCAPARSIYRIVSRNPYTIIDQDPLSFFADADDLALSGQILLLEDRPESSEKVVSVLAVADTEAIGKTQRLIAQLDEVHEFNVAAHRKNLRAFGFWRKNSAAGSSSSSSGLAAVTLPHVAGVQPNS